MKSVHWFVRSKRIDKEIDRVWAAWRRIRETINKFNARFDSTIHCCPSCLFGAEYSDTVDKFDRVSRWLVVLLRKRATGDDLRYARWLIAEVGPEPQKAKTPASPVKVSGRNPLRFRR